MTLDELARRLECRLDGPAGAGAIEVTRVAALSDAQPGDLSFFSNAKYSAQVDSTHASAVIADDTLTTAPCPVLRTKDVYLAFARAVGLLSSPPAPVRGISPMASIDPTATLGPDVSIAPFVFIGAGARIGARTVIRSHVAIEREAAVGEDCLVHSHVAIRDRVQVGNRVILQNGVVLGGDGFGFARRPEGTHEKIPQVGGVVIEDDVEIGANSTVDRPAVGETRIAAGTKIDNLVMVAHGVKIGRNALLAAQVGVAGSTTLEDGVVMAGQSGATGHIRLGKGAVVSAKSAVTKDVAPGRQVAGIPAGDIAEWRESTVLLRRLPELRRLISDLEARLAALESSIKR